MCKVRDHYVLRQKRDFEHQLESDYLFLEKYYVFGTKKEF